MKLDDILQEKTTNKQCNNYQVVYIDENHNVYDQRMNKIGSVQDFAYERSVLDEDWGSSDWSIALRDFKRNIKHGMSIEDAARETAEFYNDEEWEKFSPEMLIHMAKVRGVIDEDGNLITEAAKRQIKRIGRELKKRYRCTTGQKKGKLVSDPSKCAGRKDPKRVRVGRKVMRSKKNTIARKTKIAKRKQISKMVSRINQRLMGKEKKKGKQSPSGPGKNPAQGPQQTNVSGTTRSQKGTVNRSKPK